MSLTPLAQEVAHQSGLLPLAAVLVLHRRGLDAPWAFVAAGLSMSWVADSLSWFTGYSWQFSFMWLPVQFTLVLWAFLPRWVDRLIAANLVAAVAIVSQEITSPGRPDVLLTVIGSAAVLKLASGSLRSVVWAYFGAGTAAYLWMVSRIGADIMPAWYTYQSCRLVAYLIFAGIALRLVQTQRRAECGKSYPV